MYFWWLYWNIVIYFSLIYLSINSFGACSSCGNVTDLYLTSVEERSPFLKNSWYRSVSLVFDIFRSSSRIMISTQTKFILCSYLGSNRRLVIYWLMLRSCAISWSTLKSIYLNSCLAVKPRLLIVYIVMFKFCPIFDLNWNMAWLNSSLYQVACMAWNFKQTEPIKPLVWNVNGLFTVNSLNKSININKI